MTEMTEEEAREYFQGIFKRFIPKTCDEEKLAHLLQIIEQIGPDEIEFILRTTELTVEEKVDFKDLPTEEKIMRVWDYLQPAIIGFACVMADRWVQRLLNP